MARADYLTSKEPTHTQAAVEDWQMGLITCNRLGEIFGLVVFELTPELLRLEEKWGDRMTVPQAAVWSAISETRERHLALLGEE